MLLCVKRWTASLLIIVGALLVVVTVAPPRWYAQALSGLWTASSGSTLIVLGSDSIGEGILGESSYWRCVYAIRVWRESDFHHLILSGESEITVPMRNFIVCHGVPEKAVVVEDRSTNTHENALFTAQIARLLPGPFVLLTSDYHMWRAHRAFKKMGLAVIPRPFPDALKRFNTVRLRWGVFIELLEESGKIVYYWWRGWI